MHEARRICREEDDFGFVRKYLDRELAEKLDLFAFEAKNDGEIRVVTRDLNAIREAILSPKFNYGAPRIAATEMKQDGSLVLTHDHASDGRGLDVARGNRVLQYIRRVWRRPVRLNTVDSPAAARTRVGCSARRRSRRMPASVLAASSRPACSRCTKPAGRTGRRDRQRSERDARAWRRRRETLARRGTSCRSRPDLHERGPFPTGSAVPPRAGFRSRV
jgi:hypothetical protein